MLRINLLPAYVAQRRVTRTLLGVYVALFAVVVLILGGWWLALVPQDASMRQKAADAQAAKSAVDAVNAQASTAQSAVQPLLANLTWVKAVHQYNLAYIKLYQTVADYTSPKVLYNSVSLSGSDLTISGYTPSLPDLGRYLLSMYKEPDASAVALTSPIPGYSSPDPDSPQQISLPGGVTGRLPGYPLPVYSYTVYKGRIVAVNGQGKNGIGAGGAQFGPTFGGGSPFGPNMGGGRFNPVMGMGGGQFNPSMGMGGIAGQANGAKKFDPRHDGFPFTVVLTLKTAPTPPAPPVTPTPFPIAGGGGAGAGGFGGPGFAGMPFGGGGPNAGFRGGPPPGMGGPPPGYGGPPPGYANR